MSARLAAAADGAVRRRRGPGRRAGRRSDRGRAGRPGRQGRRRPDADPRALPARRDAAVRCRLQVHGHLPPHDGRRRQGRHPGLRQGRARPAPRSRVVGARASMGRPIRSTTCRDRYLAENDRLGAQGLRVMATAQRDFDPATFDPNADMLPLVTDLRLLALVGIVDPPRAEARDAIAKAHAAGIQVRMITGDHAVTAEAIATPAGHRGPGHHRRRVRGDVRRGSRPPDRRHRRHRPRGARGQGPAGRRSCGARATSWP